MRWHKVVVGAALGAVVLLAVSVATAAREEPRGEKVHRMLRHAEELEEAGRIEEAAAVRRRVEQLELREGVERDVPAEHERGERVEHFKRRVGRLMDMAHVAEEEGMPDVAHALRQRAEMLERELRGMVEAQERRPGMHGEELLARAEELRARADELDEAGEHQDADALRGQAEELEARATELGEPREVVAVLHELAREQEELRDQVAELREQVDDLRAEVAELRERLEGIEE